MSATTSGRSGGSRRPTLTGRLARIGFADISRSAGLLADPDLALLLDGGRPPGADGETEEPASAVDDELLAAFGGAADPDLALLQVVRLAGALRPDVEERSRHRPLPRTHVDDEVAPADAGVADELVSLAGAEAVPSPLPSGPAHAAGP